jgi:hypothetical protein
MISDRILATLSLVLFVGFLAFMAVYIGEIDLWIVLAAVSVMAVVDFFITLRGDGAEKS